MTSTQLKEQIAKGNLELVLEKLKAQTQGQLQNEVLQIARQHESYKRNKRLGVLSTAEANLSINKITNSLLSLVDELPNNAPANAATPAADNKMTKWVTRLTIAAAIVTILGITLKDVWKGFFTNNATDEALTLTIKVRDVAGNRPLLEEGKLVADYGNTTETAKIDEEGKVDLREIPSYLKGKAIDIILEGAKGYEAVRDQKFLLNGQPITFLVQAAKSRGWLKGRVRNEANLNPIPNARIFVGVDTVILSDSNGIFNTYLPQPMHRDNYKLNIQKEGYESKDQSHSPFSTDADIRLKRQ